MSRAMGEKKLKENRENKMEECKEKKKLRVFYVT